jgi:hypothetical protein
MVIIKQFLKKVWRLRNMWNDKVWKDAAKLLNLETWQAVARHRSDWRAKTGDAIIRTWAEGPEEG